MENNTKLICMLWSFWYLVLGTISPEISWPVTHQRIIDKYTWRVYLSQMILDVVVIYLIEYYH
ncbi:hypothetical protein BDB01DRAFT_805933 [Pilobolus umbonatus]|nr:hypothetical protein BDB01DRAFT_805933 [Pilobolus umbonatus]